MTLAQDYINRIDSITENYSDEEATKLIKEIVSVFAESIPSIRSGLDRYRAVAFAPGTKIAFDNWGDLKKLRGKLALNSEQAAVEFDDSQCNYFNLVIRANQHSEMPRERMLEKTPKHIASIFKTGNSIDIKKLSKLPTVLTSEFRVDDQSSLAMLGYIDRPSFNPSITYPVMCFPSTALLDKGILSSSTWDNSRTRWMVVEGNPFQLFANCNCIATQRSTAVVDKQLTAVMMPFKQNAELDNVYSAIKRGASLAGLKTNRVDESANPGDITEEILKLIETAAVVIVDITGLNPNVIFEYGYARGLKKTVIVLSSSSLDNLPFDIRQQRIISYHDDTRSGLEELSVNITKSIQSISSANA